MKISISNGVIYVDDIETTDPELIGYAMLDFAETTQDDTLAITLKDSDVFID